MFKEFLSFYSKKSMHLHCLALSKLRSLVTVNPATENTRSEGVEVAGLQSMLRATVASRGNLHSFPFHQFSGDSLRATGLSDI